MRSERVLILFTAWWLICALSPLARAEEARADPAAPSLAPARASLPLAEILDLHERLREAQKAPAPRPPQAATVSRISLAGKLLDDSVEISGDFDLAIMAEDRWVQVPLLHLDSDSHLSSLPQVPEGEFVVADGALNFVTRRAGRISFRIGWVQQARREGPKRSLRIRQAPAALAELRLAYDESLFHLIGDQIRHQAEGALIYPAADGFRLAWARHADRAPAPGPEQRARPPIESKAVSADASLVTTLDGHRIVRLLYDLRLQGEKTITFTLPPDLRVDKVYLNGAAVAHQAIDQSLPLSVRPPREGDRSAQLELLLLGPQGAMNLSGRLDFTLPACDWPVDELRVSAHLPRVFNYTWSGGSLSPAPDRPPVAYTHHLPTPGKHMSFGQQLVSTAPSLSVDYTVDLRGQYYAGGRGVPAAPVRAAAVEGDWRREQSR